MQMSYKQAFIKTVDQLDQQKIPVLRSNTTLWIETKQQKSIIGWYITS